MANRVNLTESKLTSETSIMSFPSLPPWPPPSPTHTSLHTTSMSVRKDLDSGGTTHLAQRVPFLVLGPVVNKKKNANLAPAFTPLYLLTVDAVSLATWRSRHQVFLTMMDCPGNKPESTLSSLSCIDWAFWCSNEAPHQKLECPNTCGISLSGQDRTTDKNQNCSLSGSLL